MHKMKYTPPPPPRRLGQREALWQGEIQTGRWEAGSAPPTGWPQANHCPSLGLGLPMARGRDWIRWSLRALLAVTFPAGTEEGKHSWMPYCVPGAHFASYLGPLRRGAVLSSTDWGADAQPVK